MADIEDLGKLKVAELRSELQSIGLDTKGNKAALIDRLREARESKDGLKSQESEKNDLQNDNEIEQEAAENVEETNGQQEEEKLECGDKEPAIKEENDQPDDSHKVGLKDDYEKAPLEDVDMKQEMTEELELKQEVKVEDMELKEEVETSTQEEAGDRRGVKRAQSPSQQHHDTSKKSRPDVEEVRVEDEPEFDTNAVVLDWYNSDLSLVINKENRLSASPLTIGGFAYCWHGVRATYGFDKGRIFYEVLVEDHLNVAHLEPEEVHPHVIRVGWSINKSSLTLGEDPLSYGYGGTGKASTNLKFKDYGKPFTKGDILGCYIDLDVEPVVLSFTLNNENLGICYEIPHATLQGAALFPHILTKNCAFKLNFGTEDPMSEPLTGYTFAAHVPVEDRVLGTQGPEKRDECEAIMMVGLPGAGKTTWVENYCKENLEKKYNVLGTNNLIDKMKVMGLPRKRNYAGRWDKLIEMCTKCLNKLLYMSTKRRRNFIIDQTNVYPSAQKRKFKGFAGYKRRAVVVCPTDEDLKIRTKKRDIEEGIDVPDKAVLEMKANFKLPEVGEFFDEVEFTELEREEAEKLIEQYNKEGESAGFGPSKKMGRGGNHAGRRGNFIDRRGGYSHRGGYRGSWDRDRDRRGNFDRRDRAGGWNRDSRDYRDRGNYNRDNRMGSGNSGSSGGGYYRDRSNRSSSSWSSGGSFSGSGSGGGRPSSNQSGYSSQSWGSQGYGNQGWGGQQSYSSGYNWNQQYYGQQQPQQQQQQQQSYWPMYGHQQSSYTQQGYNTQNYPQNSYGYSQQQQLGSGSTQQWSGYSGYGQTSQQYRK